MTHRKISDIKSILPFLVFIVTHFIFVYLVTYSFQFSDVVERKVVTISSQPASGTTVKRPIACRVFSGEECEDVNELVINYKRVVRLNGWNETNLALASGANEGRVRRAKHAN